MAEPQLTLFYPGQLGGVVAIIVFAVISAVALLSVAIRIGCLAIKHFKRDETIPSELSFFRTQLGHYAACLLVFNFINSISGWITIRWVIDKGIATGPLCRAQATLMQIGNLGQAYFTVSIAIHTFNSLVLRKKQSVVVRTCTVTAGWVLSVFLAVIPFAFKPSGGYVYGESLYSCGVTNLFPKVGFAFHLFPILFASLISAVLYSIIFLVIRGTLKIKGGVKLTLDPSDRWEDSDNINYYRFISQVARSMLWFPAAYIILLIPYSAMRLMLLSGYNISFPTKVLGYICWYILGICDVLLLYNTFRILGPVFDLPRDTTTRKDDDSFWTSQERYATRALLQRATEVLEEKVISEGSPAVRPSSVKRLSHVSNSYSQSTYSVDSAEGQRDYSSRVGQRILSGIVTGQNTSHNVTPLPMPQAGEHTSIYLSAESGWSLPPPPRPARSSQIEVQSYPDVLRPSGRKRSSDESFWNAFMSPPSQFQDQWNSVAKDGNGRPLASAVAPSFTNIEEPTPLSQLKVSYPSHTRSLSVGVSNLDTLPSEQSGKLGWKPKPMLLVGSQDIGRAATYSRVLSQRNKSVL